MTPYQNCLAHSLQVWNGNKEYNLFYDGNHVFATLAENVEHALPVNKRYYSIDYFLKFDIDEDEKELLKIYYQEK